MERPDSPEALPERPRLSPFERRLVIAADRIIYWLTAHWLLVFSLAAFVLLAGAYASPFLISHGYERSGRLIFAAYHRICHQRPERSFYVFGQQVAFCQRDVGTYLGIVVGGLLYWLSRRRLAIRSLRVYGIVFVLPVAADGLSQLLALRQSNWYLRLSTGTWFGLGTALLVYPLLAAAMKQCRDELEGRFGVGLVRLGRPRPALEEAAGDNSAIP